MRLGAALRAATCYALLVASVFCPFTLGSGMSHETVLPLMSETGSALGGFLYRDDPTRIGMTVFFHLGYLLGEAAGVGGSFVPYQIVHAVLWWARGVLVFLILRRALPGWLLFHLAAGGLVILHGADTTLSWVGAMNQQGTLVWTLAACYALLRALQAQSQSGRALAAGCAAALLTVSLWSYESQIALVCVIPLLLARSVPASGLARLSCLAPWFCVVVFYLMRSARHYLWLRPASYQASLLRGDASPAALLGDLAFLLRGNFEFWRWGDALPQHAPGGVLAGFAALAVLLLMAALALERWLQRAEAEPLPGPAPALRLVGLGMGLALLGFPAFLLLAEVRTLWRTQLLASLGGALGLCAAAAALAGLAPRRRTRELAFLLLVAPIAGFGAHSALRAGAHQRALWERHRSVMAELLQQAPDVASRSWIVLTNVPADADPFHGHNMWLEMALRLAYPGRETLGLYLRDDGTPAPGAPTLDRIPPGQAIVFRREPEGMRLLQAAPADLSLDPERWKSYAPRACILPGPASTRALRRYGGAAP